MPRNGSGSFSLAEAAFVPNTPISSSAVNSDLTDIGDALTDSLARDGQGGMTAVLPLANTGFTYLTDPNTGMRRTAADTQAISAGGVDAITITSTAVDVVALKVAGSSVFPVPTAQIADKAVTLAKLYHPTATSRLLGSDSNAALVITGAAAAAGLIRLSVASTATFATSQVKTVSDVVGTTEANGTWTITVVDATHIDLQGSTFTNAYVSGGTIGGGVEELSLGTGLTLTASVLSASPVSGPMAGAQGLVITNNSGTPNTQIDVTIEQATLLNPTGNVPFYTTSGTTTINTSTTGVVNGLDTGSRASSTWYNIYLISSGASFGGLASLSATAPTLPSGFIYYVRLGAMRTDGSGNFLRTRQLGNRTSYVPTIAMTTVGSATLTAVSTANFIPPTAPRIILGISGNTGGAANVIVPNNVSYVAGSGGVPLPPLFAIGSTFAFAVDLVLESSNIYAAASAGIVTPWCYGWVDKVNAS